ncbi:2911_t:CDS:2 [Paraglomus brasilianum]|uniref:2911_t:CDS:1 n=1 Tax=Paraglomus brasilianum TaxID=144538 RepID=A0A9N8VVL5_9GLOM|nr:2911_t:CDS:2 [Paraglomus brasilianum]
MAGIGDQASLNAFWKDIAKKEAEMSMDLLEDEEMEPRYPISVCDFFHQRKSTTTDSTKTPERQLMHHDRFTTPVYEDTETNDSFSPLLHKTTIPDYFAPIDDQNKWDKRLQRFSNQGKVKVYESRKIKKAGKIITKSSKHKQSPGTVQVLRAAQCSLTELRRLKETCAIENPFL